MAIAEFAQKFLTETSFTGIFISRRRFLRCLSLEGHGRRTCRRTGERKDRREKIVPCLSPTLTFCSTGVAAERAFAGRLLTKNVLEKLGSRKGGLFPSSSTAGKRSAKQAQTKKTSEHGLPPSRLCDRVRPDRGSVAIASIFTLSTCRRHWRQIWGFRVSRGARRDIEERATTTTSRKTNSYRSRSV